MTTLILLEGTMLVANVGQRVLKSFTSLGDNFLAIYVGLQAFEIFVQSLLMKLELPRLLLYYEQTLIFLFHLFYFLFSIFITIWQGVPPLQCLSLFFLIFFKFIFIYFILLNLNMFFPPPYLNSLKYCRINNISSEI